MHNKLLERQKESSIFYLNGNEVHFGKKVSSQLLGKPP